MVPQHRLPRPKCEAVYCPVECYGFRRRHLIRMGWEVQGMHAKHIVRAIVETQCREVVPYLPAKACGDRPQQLRKVRVGDHGCVDLQEQARPVAHPYGWALDVGVFVLTCLAHESCKYI